ncbi:MAG: PAC2 family protein [Nitrososphaerota archaeon]
MQLKILGQPPSRPSTLVAALPDMGNVAGIAVEHLVRTAGMVEFARLAGYWPPYIIHRSGETRFRRSHFSFHKPLGGQPLIVMTGDYQPQEPSALYLLCERVVEFVKGLDVSSIITLGAAHRELVMPDRRVFFAATGERLRKLAESCGALPLEGEGYITGFNGLLLGIGLENGLEGLCLLGEIDNPEIPQPLSSKSVLKVLTKLLGLGELDFSELDTMAEKIRAQILFTEEVARMRKQLGRSPPGVI